MWWQLKWDSLQIMWSNYGIKKMLLLLTDKFDNFIVTGTNNEPLSTFYLFRHLPNYRWFVAQFLGNSYYFLISMIL